MTNESEPVLAKGTRFLFVDALRGIAASWVVLFHAAEGRHLDKLLAIVPDWIETPVFWWGPLGVPIFFVLSGFVIAHSLRRDRVGGRYFVLFTLRRSIRLDPPYWASIALVVGYGCFAASIKGEPFALPTLNALAAHGFYLQGMLEYPAISPVFWTLCLEIQFYLAFCALVGLMQRLDKLGLPGRGIVFLPAAFVPLFWVFGFATDNLYPGLFLPHWHGFLLGVFAYWAWTKKMPAALFAIYALAVFVPSALNGNGFSVTVAIISSVLLVAGRAGLIASSLGYRWIQWLGKISYSLYLTHNVFTGAICYILFRVLSHSFWIEALALPVLFAGSVVGASLYWWALERPFLGLCRRVPLHVRPPLSA